MDVGFGSMEYGLMDIGRTGSRSRYLYCICHCNWNFISFNHYFIKL